MERRWLKISTGKAIGVVSIVALFTLLSFLYNFQIIDLTGNIVCEGTYENPCISYFDVKNPNSFVVDIYSKNQTKLIFSPDIYDYALFIPDGRCSATGSCACILNDGRKLGFEDWRCVDFTNKTKPRKDKEYNFRFDRYSTTHFMLAGIKNNPEDEIKWSFGVNDEELDPIWESISKDKKITTYTPSTETTCKNGVCNKVLYSAVKYVNEDNQWKKVENARRLRGSGIECVVKSDGENIAECIDWNYTSVTLKLSKKTSGDSPIRVLKYNQTKRDEFIEKEIEFTKEDLYSEKERVDYNFIDSKDNKEVVINANYGDIIHFGENSTTIQLQEENLADLVLFDESSPQHLATQIKWNITSIPSGQKITDSVLSFYIYFVVSPVDNDVRFWRVDDQSWDESSSAGTINSQSLTNQTDTTFSSIIVSTWTSFEVTDVIAEDYDAGNDYSSIRFVDVDYLMVGSISVVLDASLGSAIGVFYGDAFGYEDRENTWSTGNPPYLNITYEEAQSPESFNINITQPTTESAVSVSSGDNTTINFNFTSNISGEITSGVTMNNVTIGGLEADIVESEGAEVITELYSDNFEDGTNWLETGDCGAYWDYDSATGSGGTSPQDGDSDDSGTNFVYMETSGGSCDGSPSEGYLVFDQEIDWDAQSGENVTFKTNRYGDSDLGTMIVQENSTGSWTQLGTYTQTGDDGNSGLVWTKFGIDASSLTGQGYVRFYSYDHASYTGDAAIDDFNITYLASGASEEFEFISGIGWQVNVTVPTFADGLKDLRLNITYDGTQYNETESNSVNYGSTDTCTYTSGNWVVTCSDNCTIDSNVDLGGNNLTIDDSNGYFNIVANISNFDKVIIAKPSSCIINFNGGKLIK